MRDGVSDEPLLKKNFDRILKSVFNLSGFFGPATVHAIRRFVGKKIDGEPVPGSFSTSFWLTGPIARYTEVERSQHVLQGDPRVWGRSYVANTSSVCGRSAALDEPAQHDHVDYFQSFAKFHKTGLPTKLPAGEAAAISRHPQFLALESEMSRLKSEHGSPSQIQAAVRQTRACRLRLTRKRLQQYKLEWVRERRDWKVATRGQGRSEEPAPTDLSDILARVMPERGRLAKTMISNRVVSEKERKDAIRDLCTLTSLDCTTVYRPGEEPTQGVCPVANCSLAMKKYCHL